MSRSPFRLILAGTAVALVVGAGALAVAKGGHGWGRHHGPHKHMMHVFEYFDANADGAVERDEAQGVADAKLTEFDADGDQAITLAEFEPLWAEFTRRRMVDGFQRLDDDGDGKITKAELERPIARAFRFADRNQDGKIDPSDRPHRHGRPRGER